MGMTPKQVLTRFWGHAAFRPLQEEIIQSVLQGRDTLALLPTGGGKSVCFQVPALLRPGVCLVVTPLIALMKDQAEGLKRRGLPAAAVYSGMPMDEIIRQLDNCLYGNTRFLYLSPERLGTDMMRDYIDRMNVSLLAVDEAHCISQ
ncbi:MAG TPA: DEAD/DEAH box helicase, partial [Bacteroidales bacterium]|nr:DEAD/DEAH box helicase [Bacteroidales bacterium]